MFARIHFLQKSGALEIIPLGLLIDQLAADRRPDRLTDRLAVEAVLFRVKLSSTTLYSRASLETEDSARFLQLLR